MPDPQFAYFLASPTSDYEVAVAEGLRLTGGGLLSPRVIAADRRVGVQRAAYIGMCLECLHMAHALEQILAWLDGAGLEADGFAVRVLKRPRGFPLDSQVAAHQVGLRIGGKPNLSQPRATFTLIVDEGLFVLGRLLERNETEWAARKRRPYTFSGALDVKIARAMVNLVASPGQLVLDPCCGSGTILCEALAVGAQAVGADLSWKMVRGARLNLRHLGYEAPILMADARRIAGRFDAVVSDPPYGRWICSRKNFYEAFVANLRNLAPRACVVTHEDMSRLFEAHGWRVDAKPRQVLSNFARHVHVLSLAGAAG